MHQTVREFFRPGGPTAQSKFRISSNYTQMRISTTCVGYLILCANAASILDRAVGSKSWTSEQFEIYAAYLSERPFLNYALGYVEQHLQKCGQVSGDSKLISQLHMKLSEIPAAYIFTNWIPQSWGPRIPHHEQQDQGKHFRAELLHAAARMKYSQVVEMLLVAGAEVEACRDGRTPLMVAAESGDMATALVLLDRGALIEAGDVKGQTALHLAAANGHNPMAGLLLDRGADKESKDNKDQRPLHLAAANGQNPVVRLLIDQGADKEAKDGGGQTTMHLAAVNGHETTAQLLVDASANTEDKDNSGRATHHSLQAGIFKSDVPPTNPGDYQAPPKGREQAESDFAPSAPDEGADKSNSDGESHRQSILSLVDSIFRTTLSQSSAAPAGQAPPEVREQAEDAIAGVLVENSGVSIIVTKGVDKLGREGVDRLMTRALRQFSSAINLSLDKDMLPFRYFFMFIGHRARSIARKIRELAQSSPPAAPKKAVLTKFLEDWHSHKVPSSERVGPRKYSGSDASDEPLTPREPGHADGEELANLNEENEGDGLGESSKIKCSRGPDKSDEPHAPEYTDGEELDELNEEGEDRILGEDLLRRITEYLASDKVSSDFWDAVKRNFYKVQLLILCWRGGNG